jgi:hypothetical protein
MKFTFEYLRMVSYAIVILASLRGIAVKKFTSLLFVGDIIIALILLVSSLLASFGSIPRDLTRDYLLTPVAVIWAIIHFINILKPLEVKTIIKK